GNDKPFIEVPTAAQREQRAALTEKIAGLARAIDAPDERLDALQAAWEGMLSATFAAQTWAELGTVATKTENGANLSRNIDNLFVADGPNPAKEVYEITFEATGPIGAFKLDLFTDESLPETGPGRSPNGNIVINEFEVWRRPTSAPDTNELLAVATALADYAQENDDYRIVNAIDGNPETGWATGSHVKRENRTAIFVLDDGAIMEAGDQITLRIRQDSKYGQHTVGRFRLAQSPSRAIAQWAQPKLGTWHHVGPLALKSKDSKKLLDMVRKPESGYDPEAVYGKAKLRWEARPEWKDGTVIPLEGEKQLVHYLHRQITVSSPTALSLSLGSNDAIKLWVDGDLRHVNNVGRQVRADQDKIDLFLEPGTHDLLIKIVNYGGEAGYYFRVIDDGGRNLLALMQELATPPAERSQASRDKLRNRFRARDSIWVGKRAELAKQESALEVLKRSITTTMVMDQLEIPRDTFFLNRGAYDAPDTSEKLFPSVPAALGEMDESLPKNRLGLAKWLLEPKHPLTARVRANHYWQMYFGRGIVKTSEDLGTQGTPPTHRELLDWLATTFVESGWDVKAMQKRIVMSATYRQSSVVTAAHQAKDPENLLLGRAPRLRLPAEQLRDQALVVAGLMNPKIGGPSVFPYQPDGMWSSLTFQNKDEFSTNFYTPDTGGKLYRRGLYTFWKRTIVPPRMQIFGAAGRERCSLRNEATNTPMQALVLLNDEVFSEAARGMAGALLAETQPDSASRLHALFMRCLSRKPDGMEQEALLAYLDEQRALLAAQSPETLHALLKGGEDEANEILVERAAWTLLCRAVLNLDETITRG
ncbi:MAG: DUF1553 domain-containing protein, partial [Candidatus Hydrogenedentes bacterium]|nr:DUF1553 domain-containing protein [Candidatus Hydrogenedentota bacterium]